MTRRMNKLITHLLIITALVLSGYSTAQEIESSADATRTATVKEMQIAGSYVYLLVDEQGEDIWLATSPGFIKDISYGDVVEFFGEVEMQDFHSNGLDRTFESLWFVSKIRVIQADETEAT